LISRPTDKPHQVNYSAKLHKYGFVTRSKY
jgi:hypothetical protein